MMPPDTTYSMDDSTWDCRMEKIIFSSNIFFQGCWICPWIQTLYSFSLFVVILQLNMNEICLHLLLRLRWKPMSSIKCQIFQIFFIKFKITVHLWGKSEENWYQILDMLKKSEIFSIGVLCSVEPHGVNQIYHVILKLENQQKYYYRPKVQIAIKNWILRFFQINQLVYKLQLIIFISLVGFKFKKYHFYG